MKKPSRKNGPRGAAAVFVAFPKPRGPADELASIGAAYCMTGVAFAALARQAGKAGVLLWPKPGVKIELKGAYAVERENMLLRWRLALGGAAIRAETLRRAIALADESGAARGAAPPRLSEERKAEIARLLAEAEGEPHDPLGVTRPWESLRKESA